MSLFFFFKFNYYFIIRIAVITIISTIIINENLLAIPDGSNIFQSPLARPPKRPPRPLPKPFAAPAAVLEPGNSYS